jgi:polyhydroxybutyrate depolymerase
VDEKRVVLIGHSNGAFMAHRMACDRADRVAGIAAFAGSVWKDPSKCSPSRPVNVLQVHGTLDTVIAYNGGSATAGAPPFPSALDSVATWAAKNGCTGGTANQPAQLDLIAPVGAETTQGDYGACPAGGAVSLWTLAGGGHTPALLDSWAPALVGWLTSHPR